jgi:primary-amine oxidase
LKEGPATNKADLGSETVESFDEAEGKDMFLLQEVSGATDLAIADQAMIDGLALRGFAQTDVYCLPLSAGLFGTPLNKASN